MLDEEELDQIRAERDFWRAKFEELRPLVGLLDQALLFATQSFVEPGFAYNWPTMRPPAELEYEYAMGGKAEIVLWEEFYPARNRGLPVRLPQYFSQAPRYYSRDYVDAMVSQAKRRETHHYGIVDTWLYELLDEFPIEGKTVAVMGSLYPWYEAIVIAHGGMPVSVEYNTIYSDHPKISAIHPQDIDPRSQQVDAAISISSFEHDGLGFYGDPLDPGGDLAAMRSMREFVKPGGNLFLAVPIGKDSIVWPIRRNYGRIRFPMLLEGWRVLGSRGHNDSHFDVPFGGHHSVWALCNGT